jgi:CheY-like chemotaxis protein
MTKRILVVEDNDLNRKLFCDVLVANGFTVEPVAEGAHAIERARAFVPNLVIMDIQLQDVAEQFSVQVVVLDNEDSLRHCAPDPLPPPRKFVDMVVSHLWITDNSQR